MPLAQVELQLDDVASSAAASARESAQATFTSDAGLLALAPTGAAVEGAKAEMADLAQQAAHFQEEGRRAEAVARVQALRSVAMQAGRDAPAAMSGMLQTAREYEKDVSAIDAPGVAASKALKQKAYDAVRAPVAGW